MNADLKVKIQSELKELTDRFEHRRTRIEVALIKNEYLAVRELVGEQIEDQAKYDTLKQIINDHS